MTPKVSQNTSSMMPRKIGIANILWVRIRSICTERSCSAALAGLVHCPGTDLLDVAVRAYRPVPASRSVPRAASISSTTCWTISRSFWLMLQFIHHRPHRPPPAWWRQSAEGSCFASAWSSIMWASGWIARCNLSFAEVLVLGAFILLAWCAEPRSPAPPHPRSWRRRWAPPAHPARRKSSEYRYCRRCPLPRPSC